MKSEVDSNKESQNDRIQEACHCERSPAPHGLQGEVKVDTTHVAPRLAQTGAPRNDSLPRMNFEQEKMSCPDSMFPILELNKNC
jgi:hypothetical protein